MKFGTDIDGAEKLKPTDFGDPVTSHLAPPCGFEKDILTLVDGWPRKLLQTP